MKKLLALILILFTTPCFGETKTIDQVEAENEHKYIKESLETMLYQVETNVRKNTAACIKAFGHDRFCKCIIDNLPLEFSFDNYIAITTKTKEQNRYENLEDDIKDAYNNTIKVRDQCVEQHIKF